MYLLTEWEGCMRKYLALYDTVCTKAASQLFSLTAQPNTVNKHFIIWPNQEINYLGEKSNNNTKIAVYLPILLDFFLDKRKCGHTDLYGPAKKKPYSPTSAIIF